MITIFGGSFQDAAGNLLPNGKLTLQLTSDAQSSARDAQVAAGPLISIALDVNANCPNVSIESNANIVPTGTAYVANLYANSGVPAFLRPQLWIIPNTNTDLGTLTPTSVSGVSFPNVVLTSPGTDQAIIAFNLNPNVNNLTQSLGTVTSPWNANLNTLNVANTTNLATVVTGAITATNINASGTVNVVTLISASNLNLSGNILKYAGVQTVNAGLASEVASKFFPAGTFGNIANTNLYQAPATGLYRLSYQAKITNVGSANSALGPMSVGWQDADGVSIYTSIAHQSSGGVISSAANIANTTATFMAGVPFLMKVNTNANVFFSFPYAANVANSMQYELSTLLEAL